MVMNRLARGRTLLDCYTYSGGFSLAALANNAKSVESVDSSPVAIGLLYENIEINNDVFPEDIASKVQAVKADAVEYMKELINQKKSYDIVITDPPKLAPTRNSLEKAREKYIKINTNAMMLVNPGKNSNRYSLTLGIIEGVSCFMRCDTSFAPTHFVCRPFFTSTIHDNTSMIVYRWIAVCL
jgi:16S rRNA G966 N2-methylase RsmD